MSVTQLVLLGTGTPNIYSNRYQSSLAVIVDDIPYLIDCGGGMMQRVARAVYEKEMRCFLPQNLTRMFITHLHPDHTAGLPDFIIAPWVLHRPDPVQIVGVEGTKNLVDHILAGYEAGISEHRDGLAPIDEILVIDVTEFEWTKVQEVYSDERVTVTAFPASHGGLKAVSYKFTTADGVIVVSGDTAPTDAMCENAKGCDILVHEVYSSAYFHKYPPAWQKYHTTVHTSAIELAEIANVVRPEKLVLVHQLFSGATDDELVTEITDRYDGEVICGADLDMFTL